METFDKEYFKTLANQIMFDLSEEEQADLQESFKAMIGQINLLDSIDTEGVEEMIYPFEQETAFLREDTVDHVLTQEEALANVKSVAMGHVTVPKVVK